MLDTLCPRAKTRNFAPHSKRFHLFSPKKYKIFSCGKYIFKLRLGEFRQQIVSHIICLTYTLRLTLLLILWRPPNLKTFYKPTLVKVGLNLLYTYFTYFSVSFSVNSVTFQFSFSFSFSVSVCYSFCFVFTLSFSFCLVYLRFSGLFRLESCIAIKKCNLGRYSSIVVNSA